MGKELLPQIFRPAFQAKLSPGRPEGRFCGSIPQRRSADADGCMCIHLAEGAGWDCGVDGKSCEKNAEKWGCHTTPSLMHLWYVISKPHPFTLFDKVIFQAFYIPTFYFILYSKKAFIYASVLLHSTSGTQLVDWFSLHATAAQDGHIFLYLHFLHLGDTSISFTYSPILSQADWKFVSLRFIA